MFLLPPKQVSAKLVLRLVCPRRGRGIRKSCCSQVCEVSDAGVCPASIWSWVYSHLPFSRWCFPDPMMLSSALEKFETLLIFHTWLLCSCLPYLHMLFSQPWLGPSGLCLFRLFFWAKLPAPHPTPDSAILSWLPKCFLQSSSCYRAILGSGYGFFFFWLCISPGLVWRSSGSLLWSYLFSTFRSILAT